MNISIWHATEKTTKSYVPVYNLNSVLNVPLEDIIQLLMHYLIVFLLYAKNKKIQRKVYSPQEAQNLWIFVVTDFELKASLKSLANSSKPLPLKTSEQISLQPSCLLCHPQPKRGEASLVLPTVTKVVSGIKTGICSMHRCLALSLECYKDQHSIETVKLLFSETKRKTQRS